MARIRSVHPDICTDMGLVNVSGDAERMYVRLWTHLDDDGRCEDDMLLLKAALFPRHRHVTEADIAAWVEELVINGQLYRYERAGKRLLTVKPDRWATWQKPRRKIDSKLPAPTRADIDGTRTDNVRTPRDNDGTRAAVDGGEGRRRGAEGESEGEPTLALVHPQPSSSGTTPVSKGLAERALSHADALASSSTDTHPGGHAS